MRVTERRLLQITALASARARSAAARAGEALTTGVAVAKASDDPSRWAEGKLAQLRAAVSEGHGRSIERARGRLGQADSELDGMGEVLGRARELALQMANGGLSAADRQAAAAEVDGLRAALLAHAAARGADGEYLFSGSASTAAPFDAVGAYVGDDQALTVVSGEARVATAGVPGTFLTAAAGVDVPSVLASLSAALGANDQVGVRGTLEPLASAVDQVSQTRTRLGTQLLALDEAERSRGALEQTLAEQVDRAVAADPVTAASELARAAAALEAARAAGEKLASLLSR